jgi:hypothetical protein
MYRSQITITESKQRESRALTCVLIRGCITWSSPLGVSEPAAQCPLSVKA